MGQPRIMLVHELTFPRKITNCTKLTLLCQTQVSFHFGEWMCWELNKKMERLTRLNVPWHLLKNIGNMSVEGWTMLWQWREEKRSQTPFFLLFVLYSHTTPRGSRLSCGGQKDKTEHPCFRIGRRLWDKKGNKRSLTIWQVLYRIDTRSEWSSYWKPGKQSPWSKIDCPAACVVPKVSHP